MLGSLWGGSLLAPDDTMLFALALIAFFGTGGFGGIFLGNATADIQLHDTYFVVGHFHFMIGGVTLIGAFTAVYFWFPKMFGRMMNETLGKVHFWMTVIPFYAIFITQHFIGLGGMPSRYYAFVNYEFLEPITRMNVFITWSAFVLGIGQLVFAANFIASVLRGRKAGNNPWEATGLEWTTVSPPPHGNWADPPGVYRWPYEYAVEGEDDFVPQDVAA